MTRYTIIKDGYPFIFTGLAATILVGFLADPAFAGIPLILTIYFAYFFREPDRPLPDDPHVLYSPADGTVMAVEEFFDDEFLHEEAKKVTIFLSVFNVHTNRAPMKGYVKYLRYTCGGFEPAFKGSAPIVNERMAIGLENEQSRVLVVQIAGILARRIVSWTSLGKQLLQGETYGMIKFGSSTELIVPRDVEILVKKGDKVKGGITMNYRRMVPNSISGLSMVLGVLSIYLSMDGEFSRAAIFIILAVLADSCDGRAARLLGVSGEFGKEMDSICDVCSFGMAPAVLIYTYGLTDLGLWGQIISSLFTFGAGLRLARFNVNTSVVSGYFEGMPAPAGACVLVTYVLSGYQFGPMGTAILTLLVAKLMYSEVRYPDFKGHGNPLFKVPVILSFAIGLYMLVTNFHAWPFIIMFTYTICGVLNAIYVKVTGKKAGE